MSNVLNRTTNQYLQSVNTPDYPVSDWIINPDLSAVVGVPSKYWEITGDTVTEMTPAEKAVVDATDPTPANGQNYLVTAYDNTNKIITETWYRDKSSTGSYSTKVKENVYTYSELGNTVVQVDTNYFTLGGAIWSTTSQTYFTDPTINTTYTENTI